MHFYNIAWNILKQLQVNPYLGITFVEDIKWLTHINNNCKRANSAIEFFRRNLRLCPKPCCKNVYSALVCSKTEYGCTIWDPYTKSDINELERLQRNIARFITCKQPHLQGSECVASMLQQLELPSFQERQQLHRLTFMYKMVEGQVPAINIRDYPIPQGKMVDQSKTISWLYQYEHCGNISV